VTRAAHSTAPDRSPRAFALAYARQGWPVFPCYEYDPTAADCACPATSPTREDGRCRRPGKHPRTPDGWKSATTDAATITRWWTRWPTANVAIATGPAGLLVLDIDPRHDGDTHLHALTERHGALPDTPTADTGGGGQHYLFRAPEGGLRVKPLEAGVEVKSAGGYIIAPPSTHASGRAYVWQLGCSPADLPLAEPPAWITAAATAPREYQPSTAGVLDGIVGRAFHHAGWLGGQATATGAQPARCPWEDDHTGGTTYDGSTVVWPPSPGYRRGHWHCSHAHCATRTQEDVWAALPASARHTAAGEIVAVPPTLRLVRDTGTPGSDPVQTDGVPDPKPDTSPAEPWRASLRVGANGKVEPFEGNAALYLTHDPLWAGVLAYDIHADVIRFARPAPPMPGLVAPAVGSRLSDESLSYIRHWLSARNGKAWRREDVAGAVALAARHQTVHPLQQYLTGLSWDGVGRVGTWLQQYLGATDTHYASQVGIWWLVSAVARAMRPGCQADHVLVLEGAQGIGKSSALRILGGAWYLGSLPDLQHVDALRTLQGRWIVEIGELDALRGARGTRVKDFLTQTIDHYRQPYARTGVTRPRSCVFAGTTNESQYLHDPTGARRFWPVAVRGGDLAALRQDRDQLWAEAVALFREGVDWWPSAGAAPLIQAEQEDRFVQDEWEPTVRAVAEEHPAGVDVGKILERLGYTERRDWSRPEQMRVAGILRHLGYRQGPRPHRGGRLWVRAS